jgi:uncharacterized membrane protein YhaH (DUF805 family)
VDIRHFLWFFFGLSGRINRMAYLLAGLFLGVIQLFLLYRFSMAPQDTAQAESWAMLFWGVVFVSLWSNFALSVKRLHDMGRPGLIALAVFVPMLAIIAFVVLCFLPGTPGPNAYGSRTNAPKD